MYPPLHPNPNLNPRQFSPTTSFADSNPSSFATPGPTSSPEPSSGASDSPLSFSSDFRPTTFQEVPSTSGAVASSTPVFSTTFFSATPTSPFSSIASTPPPSGSTTAPPSSSSYFSSTATPPIPSSPSSGFVFSTFTSSFVSDINGSPTTIVTPIVTSLRASPPSSSSSRVAVIAGSAVAGLAVLLIALTALFIIRRRKRRQRYWAISRKRLPSRATFLAGEEMDLPFPSPPFATADHDDPLASHSIRRSSSIGSHRGIGAGPGPYAQSFYSRSQSSNAHVLPPRPSSTSSPPRLLRARASESGSIFQESVWPPPSALIDPLTSPSQSVDLARIVSDIMGAHGSAHETGPLLPFAGTSRGHEHEHEQEQEVQEGGERRSMISPPLTLELAPPNTNPDDWPPRPSSDSLSHPQLQSQLQPPSTPSPPATPPRSPWLSRSPNPSPKASHSPLQHTHPV